MKSFTSSTWGLYSAAPVMAAWSGRAGGYRRRRGALAADAGPHVWLENTGARPAQLNRVVFGDHADGWLYDQGNARSVWATHDGGASWQEVTLPGNVQTIAASAHAYTPWPAAGCTAARSARTRGRRSRRGRGPVP